MGRKNSLTFSEKDLNLLDDIEHWLDLRSPYAISEAFQLVKELFSRQGGTTAHKNKDTIKVGENLDKKLRALEKKIRGSKKLHPFWKALLISKLERISWLNEDYLDSKENKRKSFEEMQREVENVAANLHCLTKSECWEKKSFKNKKKGNSNNKEQSISGYNGEIEKVKRSLIYSELAILYASPGLDRYDLSLGYAENALQCARKIEENERKKENKIKKVKSRLERIALYSQGLAYHHLHREIDALKVFSSKELDFRDGNPAEDKRELYLKVYAQIWRADALIHLQRCFEALWLLSSASKKNSSNSSFLFPHSYIVELAKHKENGIYPYHHVLTSTYIKIAEALIDMRLFKKARTALEDAFKQATKRKGYFNAHKIDPAILPEIFYHMARLKFEKARELISECKLIDDEEKVEKLLEEIWKLLFENIDEKKQTSSDKDKLEKDGAASLLVQAIKFEDEYSFKLTNKRLSQIVQKFADIGLAISDLIQDLKKGVSEKQKYKELIEQRMIKNYREKAKEIKKQLKIALSDSFSALQRKHLNITLKIYLSALNLSQWRDIDALLGLCSTLKNLLSSLQNVYKKEDRMKQVLEEIKNGLSKALSEVKITDKLNKDVITLLASQGIKDKWKRCERDLHSLLEESVFFEAAENITISCKDWEKPLRLLIAFIADKIRISALEREQPNTAAEAESIYDEMLDIENWSTHSRMTSSFFTKLKNEESFIDEGKNYETLLKRYPRPEDIEKRLIEYKQDILSLLQGYSVDKSWYSEFTVLRRWNSFSPVLSRESRRSRGGGYFLQLRTEVKGEGKKPKPITTGLVIDPGFDFLENFFSEGFAFLDIDAVLVSHAHRDHSEGLMAILDLPFQLEKQLRIKKPLLYLLSPGAYEKYHSILQDSRDQILDIVRLDPDDFGDNELDFSELFAGQLASEEAASKKQLKIVLISVKHRDIGGRTSIGVKVKIPSTPGGDAKNLWFVYSGDTKWSQEVTEKLFSIKKGRQLTPVTCLHIGSILDVKPHGREKRIEALEYLADEDVLRETMIKYNHLYFGGTLLALDGWLRENNNGSFNLIAVISEFGEEMRGGLRQITCEILEEFLSERFWPRWKRVVFRASPHLRILPADIGLRIELTSNPRVFCEKCQTYVKPDCITVKSYGAEESLFYLCDVCIKDPHEIRAFMEKACTHGKQFVWDLEKGQ